MCVCVCVCVCVHTQDQLLVAIKSLRRTCFIYHGSSHHWSLPAQLLPVYQAVPNNLKASLNSHAPTKGKNKLLLRIYATKEVLRYSLAL